MSQIMKPSLAQASKTVAFSQTTRFRTGSVRSSQSESVNPEYFSEDKMSSKSASPSNRARTASSSSQRPKTISTSSSIFSTSPPICSSPWRTVKKQTAQSCDSGYSASPQHRRDTRLDGKSYANFNYVTKFMSITDTQVSEVLLAKKLPKR